MAFADKECGGWTDVKFTFSFGDYLGSSTWPATQPDVQRMLRHYIDGGVNGVVLTN